MPRSFLHLSSLVFFIFCMLCTKPIRAQKDIMTRNLIYLIKPESNGLTKVDVEFKYKFVNTYGDIELICDTKSTGNLEYQYKGKKYTFYITDANIQKVKPTDPKLEFTIEGPGAFRTVKTLTVLEGHGMGGIMGNGIDVYPNAPNNDLKNPNKYKLVSVRVVGMSFENTGDLIAAIEKTIKDDALQSKIDDLTSKAENAYTMNEYSKAIALYEELVGMGQNNPNTEARLATMRQKLKGENEKRKYDDYMEKGKEAEKSSDFKAAEKFYNDAAAIPVSGNTGAANANRVKKKMEEKGKGSDGLVNGHNVTAPNSDCKLLRTRCTRGEGCAICKACQKNNEKEKQTRDAEDVKERNEKIAAEKKAAQEKAEIARKEREAAERAEKERKKQEAEEEVRRKAEEKEIAAILNENGITNDGALNSFDEMVKPFNEGGRFGFKIKDKIISVKQDAYAYIQQRYGKTKYYLLRSYKKRTIYSIIDIHLKEIPLNGITEFSAYDYDRDKGLWQFCHDRGAGDLVGEFPQGGRRDNDSKYYASKSEAIEIINPQNNGSSNVREGTVYIGLSERSYYVVPCDFYFVDDYYKIVEVKSGYRIKRLGN